MMRQMIGIARAAAQGKPIRIPEGGRLLWRWFADLSASRTYHGAGPNPISYSEIEAYARLMRWPLRPDHVQMIRRMDDAFLAELMRSLPGGTAYSRNAPEITEEAFDAVFG